MADEPFFEDWEPRHREQLVIATAEFCNIFGGCENCKGIASVDQLRSRSVGGDLHPELNGNEGVFCIWCHEQAANTERLNGRTRIC